LRQILEKIKEVLDMESPITVKEVKKLIGCMTTWGKFISNSVKNCLPFFKCLRLIKDFRRTKEAKEAFKQLK